MGEIFFKTTHSADRGKTNHGWVYKSGSINVHLNSLLLSRHQNFKRDLVLLTFSRKQFQQAGAPIEKALDRAHFLLDLIKRWNCQKHFLEEPQLACEII